MTEENVKDSQNIEENENSENEAFSENKEQTQTDAQAENTVECDQDADAQEKNEAPKAEVIDYYDKWLRVNAEYQNYRTRTVKEKEEIYKTANAKLFGEILEVVDNFERAMANKPDNDPFAEGTELIYKQLLSILEKNHVKEIEAKGKQFDPAIHMAVQMIEVEGMESDLVAEVIKKGYTLNDKVIRPAMVVVSQ